MDLPTIIGFLLAAGLVFVAIKDGLSNFVDTPSLLIVVGSGVAASLMSVPMMVFTKIGKIGAAAFKDPKNNPAKLIESLVKYS
jgi:chemotaxis protein MotA